jgi:hypothetical protein
MGFLFNDRRMREESIRFLSLSMSTTLMPYRDAICPFVSSPPRGECEQPYLDTDDA